ncbi:hypothetical protein KXV85_005746, partial [Aspergillus fumigatus]
RLRGGEGEGIAGAARRYRRHGAGAEIRHRGREGLGRHEAADGGDQPPRQVGAAGPAVHRRCRACDVADGRSGRQSRRAGRGRRGKSARRGAAAGRAERVRARCRAGAARISGEDDPAHAGRDAGQY